MEKELQKYLKDGISIGKKDDYYQVFTVPTQYFKISSLDELTPETFEKAEQKQKDFQKMSDELFKFGQLDMGCTRRPLGLAPKWLIQEKRRNEISEAMSRYLTAGLKVPTEWVEEYNELVESIIIT